MAITLNGTTGITNDGAYTGDGVVFADGTPSNTLVTNTSGNVGIGTSSPYAVGGSWRMLNVGVGGIQGGSSPSQSSLLVQNCFYNGSSWQRATTGATGYIDIGSGTIIFSNDSSGSAGTFTPSERMRIDSSGNLLVGTTSLPESGGVGTAVRTSQIQLRNSGTSQFFQMAFYNGNGAVGSISTSGSATSFTTSSDYRLKENIVPMTGALAKVSALNPVTFNWKGDGVAGQGFIAHELQEVVPECVTGEKDAVDAEGNPVYQGIDTSFLTATLTAAIQELHEVVKAQAIEIAELKAKIQ